MKKALLITYYWPPAGGAGVHRWLRMSKYFKENGIELIVFCPSNAAYLINDPNLVNEIPHSISIIQNKISEPNQWIKNNPSKGAGFISDKKMGLATKLFIWVRGNLFLPDARMLWIRPSARFLKKYLLENPEIKTVISSGPPHSTHLIARKLKRTFQNLNWIADFRDPWTGIDFYHELKISKLADSIQHKMEKSVLKEATHVVTISNSIADELSQIVTRKIEVITNGYIFDKIEATQLKEKFVIAHFGSLSESRNPNVLWRQLSKMIEIDASFSNDLSIELYGNVDLSIMKSIDENNLSQFVSIVGNVNHGESLKIQKQVQVLLLLVNNTGNVNGTLTGKFFEYLNSKRPILAIGPKDGDLDKVIRKTESGILCPFDDDGRNE